MKKRLFILATLLSVITLFAGAQAKYIFYFIGDGMGMGHVNATETYNRDILQSQDPLLMLTFPVASQVRTFSASHPITDSAAAGTALSTGSKTVNYRIGMSPDSLNLYSISTDFLNHGYAIGIASTVAGDDATPGAFYAHALDRKMKYTLAPYAATSGASFLAAPVWRGMFDKDGKLNDWRDSMKKAGYTLLDGYSEFTSLKKMPNKSLLLSTNPQGDQVGFTIDSIAGALTLAQITEAGIKQLTAADKGDGFFFMVEAGNIDWAAHANDGGAVIKEILNFQQAISKAYDFYLAHPDETLIVITADHDTGGMALGRKENRNPNLALIDYQHISKDRFSDYCKALLAEGKTMTWEEMKDFLSQNLGFFGVVKVSPQQEAELHEAFNAAFINRNTEDEKGLYNSFNHFAVKTYDILNQALGIGWTTTNHTGNFVPLYAVGCGASLFTHNLNNTEIPMLILKAAGLNR
jgi:alkaline phosphatase